MSTLSLFDRAMKPRSSSASLAFTNSHAPSRKPRCRDMVASLRTEWHWVTPGGSRFMVQPLFWRIKHFL